MSPPTKHPPVIFRCACGFKATSKYAAKHHRQLCTIYERALQQLGEAEARP